MDLEQQKEIEKLRLEIQRLHNENTEIVISNRKELSNAGTE